MNGDDKVIYGAVLDIKETITIIKVDVATIKTKQSERHKENINKFDMIFDKLEGVKSVEDLKQDVNRLQWIVFVVIVLGMFMQFGG